MLTKIINQETQLDLKAENQTKLKNALEKFFETMELSEILEAQNQMMCGFLEQEINNYDKLEVANTIYQINRQSTFMVQLYEVYQEMRKEG